MLFMLLARTHCAHYKSFTFLLSQVSHDGGNGEKREYKIGRKGGEMERKNAPK